MVETRPSGRRIGRRTRAGRLGTPTLGPAAAHALTRPDGGSGKTRCARKILAAAVRPRCPIYPRISEPRSDKTAAAASPPTSALPKIRKTACVRCPQWGCPHFGGQERRSWDAPDRVAGKRKAPGSAFPPKPVPEGTSTRGSSRPEGLSVTFRLPLAVPSSSGDDITQPGAPDNPSSLAR